MRASLCAMVAFAVSASAGDKANSKLDLKRLEGTWEIVGFEVDGKLQPKDKSPQAIVIANGKLTGIGPEMSMTIDASKKPKWMDLSFKKADKDYPIRAIYAIDGDELKLCIPLAPVGKGFENKRPENFDTTGKVVALFKAKRMAK